MSGFSKNSCSSPALKREAYLRKVEKETFRHSPRRSTKRKLIHEDIENDVNRSNVSRKCTDPQNSMMKCHGAENKHRLKNEVEEDEDHDLLLAIHLSQQDLEKGKQQEAKKLGKEQDQDNSHGVSTATMCKPPACRDSVKSFVCSFCGITEVSFDIFNEHVQLHLAFDTTLCSTISSVREACPICKMTFENSTILIDHVERIHTPSKNESKFVKKESGNYHGCLEKADAECNWKLFYSIYLLDPTFYAKRVFKTYKSGNFQWNVLDGSKVKEPWIHMFWEQLKVLNHGKPIHKDF